MNQDTMEGKTMVTAQVLVVEDDGVLAEDIARTLKCLEYGVPAVVSSGEAAIIEAAAGWPCSTAKPSSSVAGIEPVDRATSCALGMSINAPGDVVGHTTRFRDHS